MEVLVEDSWEDIGRFTGLVGYTVSCLVCPREPGKGKRGGIIWGQNKSETLTSPIVPSKQPELDGLVCGASYAPGQFLYNNRVISLQLVEFNSWVWTGKKRINDSPAKTSISPRRLQTYTRLHPL